ncbi:MAG: Gldg family protein [Myxococcales bacterium]|nr:Gldg family protein [Myxococcales bacterium]
MDSVVGNVFFGFVGLLLLVVQGFLVRDVFRSRSGSGLILASGLIVLFIGERVFAEGTSRAVVSGVGLLVALGAVGLRAWAWSVSEGARRQGHQLALAWSGVVIGSLLLYAITLEPVTTALGLSEESLVRWNGSWRALFPIFTVMGLLPVFQLDRLLAAHPVLMPAGASRAAQIQGVTAALAIALVFPVNYLAKQHDDEWNVAYFKTTRPGEATVSIVQTAADPVEAVLFFPPGNDVGREVEAYFDALKREGDGRLSVTRIDQALDPVRAEALKVRENGQIVLVQGEANQKFRIDTDIDKARRDLRKLDGLVQKQLLKLTRGQNTVYFLAGHGEANWRENEDDLRKINLYKKEILEAQNYKVKTWGVADGSTSHMPDDADTIVIAAPTEPLLPEEVQTLEKFWDDGGSLLILLDPKGAPLTELLAHIGVDQGTVPLAHAQAHADFYHGLKDRYFLATNKYGSHASVKTLSRNSQVAHMVFPGAVDLKKAEGVGAKVTTLIRTMPMAWKDADGDYERGPDESQNVYDLAVAVEQTHEDAEGKPTKESRAIVVGSVSWLSDDLLKALRANAQFSYDGIRWLTRNDDISGAVESEEDVQVVHTRNEDWAWFLLAIFAMPACVLGIGAIFIRTRRRTS